VLVRRYRRLEAVLTDRGLRERQTTENRDTVLDPASHRTGAYPDNWGI
jgi:hypothetical protein